MADFRVITDGSADLSDEIVKERDITVVPFYVLLGSGEYLKQGEDVSSKDFYDWMVGNPGVFPKSSTPSTQDYVEVFTEVAKAGEKAICICITQKFSNSYQTARIALNMVLDEYPEANISVINSMVNTVLQGLVVLEACDLRDAGVSYEDAIEKIGQIIPSGRILFTIGNIDYLAKGGRIGKLAGRVTAALSIRPIITLKEGEIFPSGIVRGREKSIIKTLNVSKQYISETFTSADEMAITIGYGYSYDEAVSFKARLEDMLSGLGIAMDVPIRHIGAVIGVHTGPHPLGIGVIKRAKI